MLLVVTEDLEDEDEDEDEEDDEEDDEDADLLLKNLPDEVHFR